MCRLAGGFSLSLCPHTPLTQHTYWTWSQKKQDRCKHKVAHPESNQRNEFILSFWAPEPPHLSCSRFAGRILTLGWSLFRVFPILLVCKVGLALRPEAVELSWWTSALPSLSYRTRIALNFLVEKVGQIKSVPTYHLWDLGVSLVRISRATSACQERETLVMS